MTKFSHKITSHEVRFLDRASIILTLVAFVTLGLFFANSALSQDETTVVISEDEIKESLKDRLEKAIKDNPPEVEILRAWVGTLNSIANHTLTIETREGPKLASVSAETTYTLLPKRTSIEKEDLEIGSYTIAMGSLNGNQVLTASRVVVSTQMPEPSKREVHFISIKAFDPEENLITVELPGGDTRNFIVTSKATLTRKEDSEVVEAETGEIKINRSAIIIIKTEVEDEETITTLLVLHLLPTPSAEPQAAAEITKEESETTESP